MSNMLKQIVQLLNRFQEKGQSFFIEAEGKLNDINRLIEEYNYSHTETIDLQSEGIILLQDDANKWGLELRLYVSELPPESLSGIFTQNTVYRPEYKYRLNDNEIVRFLLNSGFVIGLN